MRQSIYRDSGYLCRALVWKGLVLFSWGVFSRIWWARRSYGQWRRIPGDIIGRGELSRRAGWSILLGMRTLWRGAEYLVQKEYVKGALVALMVLVYNILQWKGVAVTFDISKSIDDVRKQVQNTGIETKLQQDLKLQQEEIRCKHWAFERWHMHELHGFREKEREA